MKKKSGKYVVKHAILIWGATNRKVPPHDLAERLSSFITIYKF